MNESVRALQKLEMSRNDSSLAGIEKVDFENVVPRTNSNGYVYRLMDKNIVVYVGKTIHINSRLRKHFDSNMIFDRAEFSKVSLKNMSITEYYYIDKYKPKYNKDFNAPRGLSELNKIKKPYGLQSIYLEGFILENNIYPVIETNGKGLYLEGEVKEKFISKYGEYNLTDPIEKKRLKTIAEGSKRCE